MRTVFAMLTRSCDWQSLQNYARLVYADRELLHKAYSYATPEVSHKVKRVHVQLVLVRQDPKRIVGRRPALDRYSRSVCIRKSYGSPKRQRSTYHMCTCSEAALQAADV